MFKITAAEKKMVLRERAGMRADTKIHDKFKKMFPVVKDLQPLRKKGGDILEDIIREIEKSFKLKKKWRKEYPDTMSCIESVSVSPKKNIGTYLFYCRMGVPTAKVGTKDKKTWLEVRSFLKEKGLIR